jgi:hypothetical protein
LITRAARAVDGLTLGSGSWIGASNTLFGPQSRILELAPEHVITRDEGEIVREPEAVEHIRYRTKCHTLTTSLDRAQRRPRHPCPFRKQRSGQPATCPSKPNVLAKLDENAAYSRER